MFDRKKMILLLVYFLLPASSFAGSIYGDVRLLNAHPKKMAPAIVEYHGPCGTKRDSSVVRLWKKRVMGVSLWLTPKEGLQVSRLAGSQIERNIVSWQCQFRPMMTVVPRGAIVKIMNEDSITQWVLITNGYIKKRQLMQKSAGQPIEIEMNDDREVHIKSGFYPWMEAWIRPDDNVFATAETGWDGLFKFKNVPAGEYILHSWHPSLGEVSMPVEVKADKKTKVKVTYEMPSKTEPPVIESPMLKEMFETKDPGSEDPFKR